MTPHYSVYFDTMLSITDYQSHPVYRGEINNCLTQKNYRVILQIIYIIILPKNHIGTKKI